MPDYSYNFRYLRPQMFNVMRWDLFFNNFPAEVRQAVADALRNQFDNQRTAYALNSGPAGAQIALRAISDVVAEVVRSRNLPTNEGRPNVNTDPNVFTEDEMNADPRIPPKTQYELPEEPPPGTGGGTGGDTGGDTGGGNGGGTGINEGVNDDSTVNPPPTASTQEYFYVEQDGLLMRGLLDADTGQWVEQRPANYEEYLALRRGQRSSQGWSTVLKHWSVDRVKAYYDQNGQLVIRLKPSAASMRAKGYIPRYWKGRFVGWSKPSTTAAPNPATSTKTGAQAAPPPGYEYVNGKLRPIGFTEDWWKPMMSTFYRGVDPASLNFRNQFNSFYRWDPVASIWVPRYPLSGLRSLGRIPNVEEANYL